MKRTDFLDLGKQDKNDNIDKWHIEENANHQKVDDWADDLDDALVETPKDYDALKGNKNSLEERLEGVIDDDGNFILTDILVKDLERFVAYDGNNLTNRYDDFPHMVKQVENRQGFKASDIDGLTLGAYHDSGSNSIHITLKQDSSNSLDIKVWDKGEVFRLTRPNWLIEFDTGFSGYPVSCYIYLGKENFSSPNSKLHKMHLTRHGSLSQALSKGATLLNITGIGSPDSGLNHWKPTVGETFELDNHYYRIKVVNTDSIEIETPLVADYSSGTHYEVHDFNQPNIVMFFFNAIGFNPIYRQDLYGIFFAYAGFDSDEANGIDSYLNPTGYSLGLAGGANKLVFISTANPFTTTSSEGDTITIPSTLPYHSSQISSIQLVVFKVDDKGYIYDFGFDLYSEKEVRNAAGDGVTIISVPAFSCHVNSNSDLVVEYINRDRDILHDKVFRAGTSTLYPAAATKYYLAAIVHY